MRTVNDEPNLVSRPSNVDQSARHLPLIIRHLPFTILGGKGSATRSHTHTRLIEKGRAQGTEGGDHRARRNTRLFALMTVTDGRQHTRDKLEHPSDLIQHNMRKPKIKDRRDIKRQCRQMPSSSSFNMTQPPKSAKAIQYGHHRSTTGRTMSFHRENAFHGNPACELLVLTHICTFQLTRCLHRASDKRFDP